MGGLIGPESRQAGRADSGPTPSFDHRAFYQFLGRSEPWRIAHIIGCTRRWRFDWCVCVWGGGVWGVWGVWGVRGVWYAVCCVWCVKIGSPNVEHNALLLQVVSLS